MPRLRQRRSPKAVWDQRTDGILEGVAVPRPPAAPLSQRDTVALEEGTGRRVIVVQGFYGPRLEEAPHGA